MTIGTTVTSIWDGFVGFWENDVWAGLKKLFQITIQDEVTALMPIASQVITAIENDILAATSLSNFGSLIGKAFSDVAAAAEAAGISAAKSSLVTVVTSAIGSVLGNAAAATPAVAPSDPTTPSV